MSEHVGAQYAEGLLGVGALPRQTWSLSADFSSLLAPIFYSWVLQLLLPIM